jgi:hypothetical protein
MTLTAACSGSAHPPSGGPDAYDVAAARTCAAFDRYVNDIKSHQTNEADSTAFNAALAKLTSGHGKGSRWSVLVMDLNNFLIDGEYENLPALNTDGLASGQQCATIPAAAKTAGGFN